jgi:hypothetical protein
VQEVPRERHETARITPKPLGLTDKLNRPQEKICYLLDWIDMTQKYGIGYFLSNGMHGVVFNDQTKLIESGIKFTYYAYQQGKEDI